MTKKEMTPEQKQLMLLIRKCIETGDPAKVLAAASAAVEAFERAGITNGLSALGPLPSDRDGMIEWYKRAIEVRPDLAPPEMDVEAEVSEMERDLELEPDPSLSIEDRLARIRAALKRSDGESS